MPQLQDHLGSRKKRNCNAKTTQHLGQLLKEHWPMGTDEAPQPFPGYYHRFYDHGLFCHAANQLDEHGSLFMFSSWFLEHGNKWWKRFLLTHTSNGGGTSPDPLPQAFKRFALLTHPGVQAEVEKLMARRRPVYMCAGCGQPKYRGHTGTCEAAQRLKRERAAAKAAAPP